jgi:hypothetical protein
MIFIYLAAMLSDCDKIAPKVFGVESAGWFSLI